MSNFPLLYTHAYNVLIEINSSELLSGVSDFVGVLNEDVLPDEALDADGTDPPRTNGEDLRMSTDEVGEVKLPLHVLRHSMDNTPANAKSDLQYRVPDVSGSSNTALRLWWKDDATTGDAQPADDEPYGKYEVYQDCWWAWNFYTDPTGGAGSECPDDSGNGIDLDVLSGAGVPTREEADDGVGRAWLFSVSAGTRCRVPGARFPSTFIGTDGFSLVTRLHHTVDKAASQSWTLMSRGGDDTTGNGQVNLYWNTGFADGYGLDYNPPNQTRTVRMVNDHDDAASIMFTTVGLRATSYAYGDFAQTITFDPTQPDFDDAEDDIMHVGSQGYPGEYLDGQWMLVWMFSDQKPKEWYYAHVQNMDAITDFYTVGTAQSSALDRNVVFEDLVTGSEVRIFNDPHPLECQITFPADVSGSLNDTYITLGSINGTPADVEYYIWFNVNSAGTDPSLAGRTGIEVELDTNDTADDVAAAVQAELDADSLFSASVSGAVVTYTCANNGEAELPVDYDVGATYELIMGGGTGTAEVDGIESSTGTSWTADYTVRKPFRVIISILSGDGLKKAVWYKTILTTDSITVPAGALQQDNNFFRNPPSASPTGPLDEPDDLNQGTEIDLFETADPPTFRINIAGNVTSAGVTGQAFSSWAHLEWGDDSTLPRYPIAGDLLFTEVLKLVEWEPYDNDTRKRLKRVGWAEFDLSNNIKQEWIGVETTVGGVGASDQCYYEQVAGTPVDFDATGPVQQPVQIYGDASHGNFERRTLFTVRCRVQGKEFAEATMADIGETELTYRHYKFGLRNRTDTNIDVADIGIDADSNGIPDVSPYDNVTVTFLDGTGFAAWADATVYAADSVVSDGGRWYITALGGTSSGTGVGDDTGVTDWTAYSGEREIDGTYYAFDKIIDAGNSTDAITRQQIYNVIHFLQRQNLDINAGASTVNGKTSPQLLQFAATTLVCSTGVYIDDFAAADQNLIIPVDVSGTQRPFPVLTVVPVIVTVKDAVSGAAIENVRVLLEADTGGPLTAGDDILSGLTNSSGIIQDLAFNYTADQPVTGRARKGSSSTYYKTADISGTITTGGFAVTLSMIPDE